MSFNKVVIMGNLTRDPEVRTLPSGNSVARLAVAVNRTYNDKDGNKKEEVTYVDVDAFGKQAEIIGKFFTKGKPILVEGRLKLDQWEDKTTGEKKSRLGVVLEGFSFVGGKNEGGSGGDEGGSGDEAPAPRRSAAPAPRQAPPAPRQAAPSREAPPAQDIGDDDVPF
jgi:single-strand DNA-binding protein